MRSLVYDAKLLMKDVPIVTHDNDVVVKVGTAGICGTDLAIVSGDYPVKTPIILGHEIFGRIHEFPEKRHTFSVGDRVVTEINIACGRCYFCTHNMRIHCAEVQTLGISRNGGFAEYVSVPLENLHRIPQSISDREAPFIEPLAAAIELTRMCSISQNSTCAVIGAGRMGLLILQVLRLTRPKLMLVIGGSERKRTLALQYGADFVLDRGELEKAMELTQNVGFDHVVEATGNPGGMEVALRIVRPRGVIHTKSTHGVQVPFDFTKAVVKEVRIQGSRCGPFEDAISLLESGKVRVKEMITHTFKLDEYEEAFNMAHSSDSIKVMFSIS